MPPRKGWAAVYCRLSKEDEEKTARESESIRNQRALLLAWAAEHGYRIYRIYTDEEMCIRDRQWSMWFNSKQREEPYQVLTSDA